MIVFTVRSLIEDMRDEFARKFDALTAKLDDRVTIAAFNAIRADVDSLKNWRGMRDAALDEKKRISDRALAWAAVTIATLGATGAIVGVILHG